MNQRPLPVTIIAALYIVMGIVGVAYHLTDLNLRSPFQNDILWIEFVRLLAVVAGVFLLLGRNWARWLAVLWMAFHVVVGALHSTFEFAVHGVLCAAIGWFLFRPTATRYFRR